MLGDRNHRRIGVCGVLRERWFDADHASNGVWIYGSVMLNAAQHCSSFELQSCVFVISSIADDSEGIVKQC